MSHKQSQDVHSNYTDGVRVKISEKYKPPPRINLAMTYSQRIQLNKQLQDGMPKYDFSMETSIKTRMQEWRTARNAVDANKKEKLTRIRDERRRIAEEKSKREEQLELEKSENDRTAVNENDANQPNNLSTCKETYVTGGVLIPTQVNTNNYANILTPIPLSGPTNVLKVNEKSPINISDFETDTSSPFDNVELNTINDMEELKIVLENDDKKRSTQANYLSTTPTTYASQEQVKYYGYNVGQSSNSAYVNGYSYYSPESLHPNINSSFNLYDYGNGKTEYSNSFDAQTPASDKLPFRSVPDIMNALHTELNSARIDDDSPRPDYSTKAGVVGRTRPVHSNDSPKTDSLENPFEYLPKNLQEICIVISSMGFPLPRVARACKDLGDDEKKIVEHLLAMSELLDLGFSEKLVSSALLRSNNDRDKALELLIS